MSVQLITYGADRRLVLGAAEAVRLPIYADSWTQLRIGLQCSFDAVASNITSTPVLAYGVCNGSTNVMVSGTSDHLIGYRNHAATLTYAAGPPSTFTGASGAYRMFKRIGAVVTTADTGSAGRFWSNTTAIRSAMFLEITKGSPNYTFRVGNCNSLAGAQTDVSDNQFLSVMELGALSDIATVLTNYIGSLTATLAVDEVDGILNYLFVYWEKSSHKFTFNIRHRKIA